MKEMEATSTIEKQVKVIFKAIPITSGPSDTFSTSPGALSCAQPQSEYPKWSWMLCYSRSFPPSHPVSLPLGPIKTLLTVELQALPSFCFACGYIVALAFLLDYKPLEERNPPLLNTSHI